LQLLEERYGKTVAIRSTVPLVARGAKASLIAMLGGRSLRKLIVEGGMRTNSDFAGVYDFKATRPYAERARGWIRSLVDDGLMMCHPEMTSGHSSARSDEHEYLASANWRRLLAEYDVQLTRFVGLRQD
jgi:hypothetical protein